MCMALKDFGVIALRDIKTIWKSIFPLSFTHSTLCVCQLEDEFELLLYSTFLLNLNPGSWVFKYSWLHFFEQYLHVLRSEKYMLDLCFLMPVVWIQLCWLHSLLLYGTYTCGKSSRAESEGCDYERFAKSLPLPNSWFWCWLLFWLHLQVQPIRSLISTWLSAPVGPCSGQ